MRFTASAKIVSYGELFEEFGKVYGMIDAEFCGGVATLTFKGPEASAMPLTLMPGDEVIIDAVSAAETAYVRRCTIIHMEGGPTGRNISIAA